jgi:two-component system invasion response regulator UvrY
MPRVLIVDNHAVVRQGLKAILQEGLGASPVGEASTSGEALRLAQEQEWDVVVLDISLAGRDGIEVLKELKQIRPRLPVLILTMHSEEQYAKRRVQSGRGRVYNQGQPAHGTGQGPHQSHRGR